MLTLGTLSNLSSEARYSFCSTQSVYVSPKPFYDCFHMGRQNGIWPDIDIKCSNFELLMHVVCLKTKGL